jgi:hypothetical protein
MQPTVKVLLSGLVFAFSLPNLGATSANATDLVFASLTRGASFVGLDGNVRVSVDFRIRNRNAPTAGIFKTAAEARGDPTNPRAWFTLPLRWDSCSPPHAGVTDGMRGHAIHFLLAALWGARRA